MVKKSQERLVNISIFILGIVLFMLITGIVLKNEEEVRIQDKYSGLSERISRISDNFDNVLIQGRSDAIFLSNDEDIIGYASNITTRNSSTELFLAYAKARKSFNHLEYIDETGQEKIRVYYDRSISDYMVLPPEQLSDLSNTPFFKKTIDLNGLYSSDIQKIRSSGRNDEITILYAAPVIDPTGANKGIVAVGLDLDANLKKIHRELAGDNHNKEYFIVDQDGNYFYNYNNRGATSGNLKIDYPLASQVMLSGTDGKILDVNFGLAAFHTYRYNPSNMSQYIVVIGMDKFALIYKMLLDGILIAIGLISYAFLIYAYRKFIKGDFKKLLRSILLMLTFFYIYKFFEIAEAYFEEIEGIFIIEQTALIFGLLTIVYFAYQLLEFSDMYGFSDKKK